MILILNMGHSLMYIILLIVIYLANNISLIAQTNNIPSESVLLLYRDVERSIDAKNFIEAGDIATKIIEADPTFKEAYRARAYANFESHKFSEAESDILKFHELLKHDRYDVFVLLGRIQIAETNYMGAVASFEKVRKLKPSTPNIYISLAKLYYQLKNYNMAETILKDAVRLEPSYLQATARNMLKEVQKKITKKPPASRYLLEAEKEIRDGNITEALNKLDQWAASVTNSTELLEIKRNKIFEVLYNRTQYKNMINDVNRRIKGEEKSN